MAEETSLKSNRLCSQAIDIIEVEFQENSNPPCGPKIAFGSAVSLHQLERMGADLHVEHGSSVPCHDDADARLISVSDHVHHDLFQLYGCK